MQSVNAVRRRVRNAHRAAARASYAVALLAAGLMPGPAANAQDLAAIQMIPEGGQSDAQLRRDRYECHNWAVEQTGAAPAPYDPEAASDERRARRIDKVLLGAGIGAVVGGIVRGNDGGHRRHSNDDAADGALGGAVLGAAIGAIAGRGESRKDAERFAESDYVRALSACMEGRGYSVAVPGSGEN
jgi:hypothetical protein